MKRTKNVLIYFGVVLGMLSFVACENELFEKYESVSVVQAPNLEASISNVQDSTFTLNYTLGAAGWLSVAVVPGLDRPAPSGEDLKFKRAAQAVQSFHFEVPAGSLSGQLAVKGLMPDTDYSVYAAATSVEGATGEVKGMSFKSSDDVPPTLKSTTPAVSATANRADDFSVTLTFDERVVVNNKAGMVFGYLNIVTFEFTNVPVDSVRVDNDKVIAYQSHKPLPGQFVFLSVSADAIRDGAGNFYAGISSGLTEQGAPAGLYWRIAFDPIEYTEVMPDTDDAVQDPNFVIELHYDLPMDFYRGAANAVVYDQKKVKVSYRMGGTTINVEVPQANITFAGNVVTVKPPRTPIFGETVSLAVDSAAFRTRYGSANAKIPAGELEWLLSYGYTRDKIIGNFNVTYVNQDNVTVGTAGASIAAGTSANAILVQNLAKNYFSFAADDTPANGVFNGDFATIAINDWQIINDHSVSGGTVPGKVYFANRFSEDPVVGQIDADGNIVMNGWGFYFLSLDGETFGWLARFNTTAWNKTTAKFNNFSQGVKELELDTSNPKRIR